MRKYFDEPTCPYCGVVFVDDFVDDDGKILMGDDIEVTCQECKKTFYVLRAFNTLKYVSWEKPASIKKARGEE